MRRFWKVADAVERDSGWAVELDGKALRTPARKLLTVPTEALARAISGEWNAVEEKIDPRSMPLTGLANAAVDRVAPSRRVFAEGLARFAEADLACYRAEGPRALVDLQADHWDQLLGWGRRRFDVDFNTTTGIVHVAQPAATVERLVHAISALDDFHLAGLSPLVTIGGSLLAALGVLEGAFAPEQAWDAVSVDDRWQLEQWGSDAEAEAALANRRWDFLAAARYLELLS
jgi:chaperone required for assembly of F1-ATPase